MVNSMTSPMAKSIAVVNCSLPPHIVSVQLMIFTPVGTAIIIVAIENTRTEIGPSPLANMWWAHTPQPTKPIAAPEMATNLYPNSGLRLNTGSTSDTMPKLGSTRMYTSGWPKIQNRCCQSKGSAPCFTSKKAPPKPREKLSRNSATVMTGIANTSRNCTTIIIQVKMGILNRLMPGARMLMQVTMRLIAPVSEAMPVIWSPNAQKSTPCPGENILVEFGAYMNQPPSAPPPRNQDRLTKIAPATKVQRPNALILGNATSRAPICSGTK
ncbi:unannotated protein [freshwater metagenome]|uniref:Unannotated protein n=1 Tax=freshwater metagenome TaxID=449393 RepID=A0A6J6RQY0_9ZZZZ